MSPPKSNGTVRWDERFAQSAQGYMSRARGESQRETLVKAHRYSAFVRVMKRALPLAALALGLAVLGYALQPRETGRVTMTFERLGTIENDLAMVNPRLTGTNDEGLPFVVTAASAVQEGKGAQRVRLEDVNAELTLADGGMLRVRASKGVVDTASRQLEVSGGITFASADGLTAETQSAFADLNTGIVSGTSRITATSKFGRITADRFTFNKDSRLLRFEGQVSTVLNGTSP